MTKIRRYARFLSRKVVQVFTLSIAIGAVLSAVELAFAYGLQLYLQSLGLSSAQALHFPSWLPLQSEKYTLLFLFVVSILRALLLWSQTYLQGATVDHYSYTQRSRILEYVFNSDTASTNKLSALFNERIHFSSITVVGIQLFLLQATATVLLGVALCRISVPATALSVGLMSLFVLPLLLLNKKIKRTGEGLTSEWSKTNNRLMSSIKNILLLRIYGVQQREGALAQGNLKSYRDHMLRYHRTSGFSYAYPQVIAIVLLCSITLLARSWLNLPPTLLIAYFYLFLRFAQSLSSLNQATSDILLGWPQWKELYTWWANDYQSLARRRIAPEALIPLNVSEGTQNPMGWRIENISFSYPGAKHMMIERLTADIKPGSFAAIIGPSGAGKTTLISLLLGFLTPLEGQIQLEMNGSSSLLSESKHQMNRHIGYVGTDPFITEGTVLENITFGLPGPVSDADIQDAIQKSECDFIFRLPNGLEHRLTEQGQGLSAGQLQRLALTRALLRKPKALILDEATSNLDAGTEQRILQTLTQLKGEFTIVAVTHRESLLSFSDQVLKLSKE